MDSSTVMCFLQTDIRHKNCVRKVATVFLCDVSIRRNLCLKLQKVMVTTHAIRHGNTNNFRVFKTFSANRDIEQKNGF